MTVPVGIPADTDFTAAVSVMDSLKLEGFLEEVRVVVEVALFTVWVSLEEVLAEKLVSPP